MKSIILKMIDALNLYKLFNYFTTDTATVFMLHRIYANDSDSNDDINTLLLERFFAYLKSNKYSVISLSDFIKSLRNGNHLYKSVVFTVDDGYRDFYLNAFPVFRKYKYPASVFITSDFIDLQKMFWWDIIEYLFLNTDRISYTNRHLDFSVDQLTSREIRLNASRDMIEKCKTVPNDDKWQIINTLSKEFNISIPERATGIYEPSSWEEIREMHSNGIHFFPHTKTHPILTQMDTQDVEIEIIHPKMAIKQRLNTNADIFCYPNGSESDFDDNIISILQKHGYTAAVTGIGGFDDTKVRTDFFRLKRFPLHLDQMTSKQYICGLERLKHKYIFPLIKSDWTNA